MGCYALFQGIFLIQGLNPRLLWLLHWRQVLYHWAPGKPSCLIKWAKCYLWSEEHWLKRQQMLPWARMVVKLPAYGQVRQSVQVTWLLHLVSPAPASAGSSVHRFPPGVPPSFRPWVNVCVYVCVCRMGSKEKVLPLWVGFFFLSKDCLIFHSVFSPDMWLWYQSQ